jgi:glycosyltransferase involved in cell wall biosynthesis
MNILVIVELYFHKNKSGGEAYLHHFLKKIKNYTNANIEVLIPKQKENRKFEFEGIIINETVETVEECEVYFDTADCVVTQLMLSGQVIDMALEKDKEVIWVLHGYFAGFNKLMRHDRVIKIFNSQNVLVDFSNNSGKINNYFIIYPFTNFPLLSQYKDKELERREYITFVNPVKNKGVELILKLAKRNSDKKFLIVEGGYSQEEQQQYITRFRELSNTHIIKNTKNIIEDIYLKSKIVIMPSFYESYGYYKQEYKRSCGKLGAVVSWWEW